MLYKTVSSLQPDVGRGFLHVSNVFLLYLAQMITIIRGCVACYVFFKIWKFEFLANFLLVQTMACRLTGAKPLSEPVLEYC